MSNTTHLLQGLETYQQSLEQHILRLQHEFEHLERRWQALSSVYEGQSADDFRAYWLRTRTDFEEYILATTRINALLQERIVALRRFDHSTVHTVSGTGGSISTVTSGFMSGGGSSTENGGGLASSHTSTRSSASVKRSEQATPQNLGWRETSYGSLTGFVRDLDTQEGQLFVSEYRLSEDVCISVKTLKSTGFETKYAIMTGFAEVKIEPIRNSNGDVVGQRARLINIEVDEMYRKKGLGQELMNEIEYQVRNFDVTEIYGIFDPKEDRDRVRKFYIKQGFQFRKIDNYYQIYKNF